MITNINSFIAIFCLFLIFFFGIISYNEASKKIDYIQLMLNKEQQQRQQRQQQQQYSYQ